MSSRLPRHRAQPAHAISPLHDERLPVPDVTETDCEQVWAEFQRLHGAGEPDFPPTQPLPRDVVPRRQRR
ncbi:hypothetical protein ACT80S_18010 [Ramlibacter sp. MAHUQ-53]|uniref:hypothetical protein n=1 Tax=unclassified Ramlibacter TaxID=2617605 RepID=UPI0036259D54